MPNWKKLITSGSSAALGNLDVTNAVTASFFVGDGSALTGVVAAANPFVTTPTTLSSNFSTSANTMNILQSPAGAAFTINSGVTLTIVETSTVIVQTI